MARISPLMVLPPALFAGLAVIAANGRSRMSNEPTTQLNARETHAAFSVHSERGMNSSGKVYEHFAWSFHDRNAH